jgi:hypothetical protein
LPRSTSTNSSDRVLPNASRRRFRWLSKSGVGARHWSFRGEGFRTRGGAFRSCSSPSDGTRTRTENVPQLDDRAPPRQFQIFLGFRNHVDQLSVSVSDLRAAIEKPQPDALASALLDLAARDSGALFTYRHGSNRRSRFGNLSCSAGRLIWSVMRQLLGRALWRCCFRIGGLRRSRILYNRCRRRLVCGQPWIGKPPGLW